MRRWATRSPSRRCAKCWAGGDLRSIGRVPEVLRIVGARPERTRELVECLTCGDPAVRARAAGALEKLTARRHDLPAPFGKTLPREAAGSAQQEIRWHMAQVLPRLPLPPGKFPASFRSCAATFVTAATSYGCVRRRRCTSCRSRPPPCAAT